MIRRNIGELLARDAVPRPDALEAEALMIGPMSQFEADAVQTWSEAVERSNDLLMTWMTATQNATRSVHAAHVTSTLAGTSHVGNPAVSITYEQEFWYRRAVSPLALILYGANRDRESLDSLWSGASAEEITSAANTRAVQSGEADDIGAVSIAADDWANETPQIRSSTTALLRKLHRHWLTRVNQADAPPSSPETEGEIER